MIQFGIFSLSGDLNVLFTAIYAHNNLEQRRILLNDIGRLHHNIQGLWFLMGYFNNVLKPQDKTGGNEVQEAEYSDLVNMIENVGLFEKGNIWDYYTWSNKQINSTIYSIIDRVIRNVVWH